MRHDIILKALLFTPSIDGNWGIPVLIEGEPGTGKTAKVKASAKRAGLSCTTLLASLREPSDFLGLPVPTDEGLTYQAPPWAVAMAKAKRGVVLFDEMNCAPPSVQAALMRVVHERVVGDEQLPAGIRILMVQNSVEDAAGGHETAIPLANRVCHIDWERPSVDEWQDYLLGGLGAVDASEVIDPAAEERRVMAAWPTAFAIAKATVAGCIRKRPELHHRKPKAGDPAASKAWPSPRSWELATRVLAGAKVHGLDDAESEMLVAGCVGTGAASEFVAFQSDLEFPDIEQLLDGQAQWKADKRLDRTMAVLSACATLIAPDTCPKRQERAKACWKMLAEQVVTAADLAIPAARTLAKARLTAMVEAKPVLVKLHPIFQAAGLM